jgi:hypothetical protein
MAERKRYLRREDVDQEYLANVIDEENIPHREVLDFATRVPHEFNPQLPKGSIMRRYQIVKTNGRASIVGFADRSVRIRDGEFRETLVEPFHIKNAWMYGLHDPGFQLQDGDVASIGDMDVVFATNRLEYYRTNLVVESFIAMATAGIYTYQSGEDAENSDIAIVIDYSTEITDLPDAGSYPESGTDFSDAAGVKPLVEYRRIKAGYRDAAGIDMTPNLIFVNAATAGQLLSVPDIANKYQPIQPSDPDGIPGTYDQFMFDGIRHVTWHKQYETPAGLADPIGDGYALVTVEVDPMTGTGPFVWHSAENKLNRQDASQPRYDFLQEGGDPPEAGIRMYDNGIPAPSRRFIIRKVKLY